MGFGSFNQSSPLFRIHLLRLASFRPVDALLGLGKQSYDAFHADLQVFLPESKSKIFLRDELLGEIGEGLWLFFLREEVGEKARKRGPRISNTTARQIPVNFKEGKGVDETVHFRLLQFEVLTHFSC